MRFRLEAAGGPPRDPKEMAEVMNPTARNPHPSTEAYRRLMTRLPYPLSFQDYVGLVEGGLNALVNGTLVIDRQGNVIFYSRSYEDFLGIAHDEVIGRPCTKVIENTRMHIVAETGISEVGHSHRIKGQDMVVQRIPIRKDGQVIGAVGLVMFRKVEDVVSLMHKLDVLASQVELYEKELAALRSARYSLRNIVGDSPAIRRAVDEILNAARSSFPVLLTGESGTGKELFAHAIHSESDRKRFPFVRLNCAAIPESLLESELFGYEPGAFTGAQKSGKPGKFELAHRGTIFLDEISEMPKSMQAKLLRVLQEKELERLGGTRIIQTDFRLIVATNRPIESLVADGHFRQDLYYRLNVIPIAIPPLRERREDIPAIIERKLQELRTELGAPLEVDLADDAMEALKQYCWPGNIRELMNLVERVVCTVKEGTIRLDHLPPTVLKKKYLKSLDERSSLQAMMGDIEKEIILETLKKTENNKAEAARRLRIDRTALYKKMRKHGIAGI